MLIWDADKQAYVPRHTRDVHEKVKTSPEEAKTNLDDPYWDYTVEQLYLEKRSTDEQAYVPRRIRDVHEKAKTNPDETLGRRAQQAHGTEREAERPYRNYTVEQLYLEKRSLKDALRDTKREQSAFARRYGGGYSRDEDYTSMAQHIARLSEDLAEIDAELFTRRQQGTGASKGRGSADNLVTVACGCRRPRRFKLTGKAYEGGPIICGNCNQPFKLALRESRFGDAGIQRPAQYEKASFRLPEDDHCSGLGLG